MTGECRGSSDEGQAKPSPQEKKPGPSCRWEPRTARGAFAELSMFRHRFDDSSQFSLYGLRYQNVIIV